MRDGSIGRAVWFAFFCELFALLSLLLVGVGCAALLFRRLTMQLILDPRTWGVVLLALLLLSLFMVGLHAVWGLVLEGGIRRIGHSTNANRGLRFGLYACGWDLLTSPAGFFASIFTQGAPGLGLPLAAARVPRRAMRSYLETCRGLTPQERTRALADSTRLVLVLFACLAAGCLSLLAYWVNHTLWP